MSRCFAQIQPPYPTTRGGCKPECHPSYQIQPWGVVGWGCQRPHIFKLSPSFSICSCILPNCWTLLALSFFSCFLRVNFSSLIHFLKSNTISIIRFTLLSIRRSLAFCCSCLCCLSCCCFTLSCSLSARCTSRCCCICVAAALCCLLCCLCCFC